MARPLWSLIYDEDPYAGFPSEETEADLQGWGSTHAVFRALFEDLRPHLVLEVGSWKGKSAIHMADIATDLSLNTNIVCIDTWLGAPEHILNRTYFASLRMRYGYPSLFYTFMRNVLEHGYEDVITPLPQTSANAAVILDKLRLRADLIYIDAAHEYEPVLSDLRAYSRLLARDGVIFGDDYPNAAGVVRAAHDFARETGSAVAAQGGKFVIVKDLPEGLSALGFEIQAQS